MIFFRILLLISLLRPCAGQVSSNVSPLQIDPSQIDIVRDQWGVPHVFAKTDAEVAYGFGWATAEDDFKTMQEQLLPVRGVMGLVRGPKGAIGDVLVHLLEADEIVAERYEKDISPQFRAYLEAYAAGVNAFAKQHKKGGVAQKTFSYFRKGYCQSVCCGCEFDGTYSKTNTATFGR